MPDHEPARFPVTLEPRSALRASIIDLYNRTHREGRAVAVDIPAGRAKSVEAHLRSYAGTRGLGVSVRIWRTVEGEHQRRSVALSAVGRYPSEEIVTVEFCARESGVRPAAVGQVHLQEEMDLAARRAARLAAGRVIGGRIRRTHPGLPELSWTAYEDDDDGWWAYGRVSSGGADRDEVVRRVVSAYASALGGRPPRQVAREDDGDAVPGATALETVAAFEDVGVTVWGMIRHT